MATENGGVGRMMMWDWEGGGVVAVLRVHVADWEQLQILKLKLGERVLTVCREQCSQEKIR